MSCALFQSRRWPHKQPEPRLWIYLMGDSQPYGPPRTLVAVRGPDRAEALFPKRFKSLGLLFGALDMAVCGCWAGCWGNTERQAGDNAPDGHL